VKYSFSSYYLDYKQTTSLYKSTYIIVYIYIYIRSVDIIYMPYNGAMSDDAMMPGYIRPKIQTKKNCPF
jgi:hypothetical protein